ncbi:uncharacterized mitochondrial protein-like protein [Tanacetum coccineum]
MDVKSVFLYGKIEEEVYVCQPPGFKDPNFPDIVYNVEKALYGLHHAPRAWYETLSTYMLDNGLQRGKIDKTLFIKRHKAEEGWNIHYQDKYVDEILKKFGFIEKSMIGSLMYFTSSRPDIMFVVCACTRYQVNPKVSHLHDVKRIFRYLKGQPKLGLWYPKDSPFDLVAYTDNDYIGASLDRKSTTGGKAKKNVRLMMENFFGMELELMLVKTVNGEVQLHALVDGKKIIINESTVRRDLQLEDAEDIVVDEVVHKELGDSLVRAATTASSLEVEQDIGGGPRRQETIGDTIAQTRFENVSKHSNDPLLARVLDLEKTKTTQAEEIVSLKRRVNKLEQEKRSRTHKLKRLRKVGATTRVESSDDESLGEDTSKQGRIIAIYADDDITLVNVQDDVNTWTGDKVFAEQEVAAKDVNLTVDEVTSAQTLAALKSVKPKVKGVVIQEPSTTTTTTTTISSQQPSQDKGKGIMVEEPVKTMKKKDLIRLDEEFSLKLQEEIDEEERIGRDEEEMINEANISWDDIQAKVNVDYQLAERLADEKRNKPPTKNLKTLILSKNCLTKALKRVNMFVDLRTELVEGSLKRAGIELEQEVTKKQKVDDVQETTKVDNNQEAAKIKELMEIVSDEKEVAIDVIPLVVKPPSIIDWKIHTEGKKRYY